MTSSSFGSLSLWSRSGNRPSLLSLLSQRPLAKPWCRRLDYDCWCRLDDGLTGFAGQVMGHAAFLAVGAYATAICSLSFGMPFWRFPSG